MKSIILLVVVVLSEAKPYFARGLGGISRSGPFGVGMAGRNEYGNGMGVPSAAGCGMGNEFGSQGFENGMRPETGMGYGSGIRPNTGLEYGRQFSNGQEYGAQQYNNGASGFGSQAVKNAGGKHYHNIGAHHRKVTNVHQEENNESHNIGGDSAFNNAAQSGGGFNNYNNGASRYGNQYGQGSENLMY